MNSSRFLTRVFCTTRIARAGVAAMGLMVLGTGACAKEYRVSLDTFLAMQQKRAAEKAVAVEETPPVDLEEYLGPYKVGPGDVLSITMTRADQTALFPAMQVRVDRNGEIELPIVETVKVADLALEDVDAKIRQAFVPNVLSDAVVYVDLIQPDSTNVLVVGAVTTAGLVPLRRTERNLLFAIVAAGGVSSQASGKATLHRIRHPQEPVTFDLTDPIQLTKSLAEAPLDSGDIIYVQAARPNTVFVGGLVTRAGPQNYPTGTYVNVLQAIAAAGGLRTDVSPREGTLIRHMPDGSDVQVKLKLNRIARGEDHNIMLAAGDILWIPETLTTRVQDFLNRNVFLRAGVSVNYNVSGAEFLNRRGQQGGGGNSLQNQFDPFGFLGRNAALQSLQGQ